jgi:hypothetical protein
MTGREAIKALIERAYEAFAETMQRPLVLWACLRCRRLRQSS